MNRGVRSLLRERVVLDRIGPILTTALALYAIATGIFLISENRRPQATLAWMLVFVSCPESD